MFVLLSKSKKIKVKECSRLTIQAQHNPGILLGHPYLVFFFELAVFK